VRLGTRFKNWLSAIVWAGVISVLSTDSFSSEHTSRLIIPALRWIFPRASIETLELMHAIIRKIAHFTEYFILGILLNHALQGNDRGWKLKWAVWAAILAAGYASLDEFHQVFVPTRTASPWDAALDTVGASCAQLYLWIWRELRARATEAKTKLMADSTAERKS
jgi:VanZ family protein